MLEILLASKLLQEKAHVAEQERRRPAREPLTMKAALVDITPRHYLRFRQSGPQIITKRSNT